jgi:acid stress-induced BolA-like protein IbaG/YrbA
MEASEIERLIKEALPDAEVRIEDLRGDGDHYSAYVRGAARQTRIKKTWTM